METYQRPLTPPDSDRVQKDPSLPQVHTLQKQQEQIFPPMQTSATTEVDPSSTSGFRQRTQRNETTQRIETEILSLLHWENPMRSAVVMSSILGSLWLTRSHSLLQLGAMAMTLAIGINLVYVHLMFQSQKVLSDQDHGTHPYRNMIDHERAIDRRHVRQLTDSGIDVVETLIRGLTRIVVIEDTKTSIRWGILSFLVWHLSAYFSSLSILTIVTLTAFTFPRLYISNKDVVDAHLQKGQTLLQDGLTRAQMTAVEGIQDTYAKARAAAAKAGTTGTDAKNTLRHASVTLKE
ncbi:hypothetical protein G6F37_010401 [Rhizopus arrhizus]|jgi:hypothetical protein|nr:hypothetical protein G6F38_010450 [Rhizopus arrhizus]KAG1153386.1 hypothetical protein G6F37_010401 [Rhizopus arrhizus]